MRWPWRRGASGDRVVASWSGQTLAYVRARPLREGGFQIVQMGVERQGTDSLDDFQGRLGALKFKGCTVSMMLRPEQYNLLQIPEPAVPRDELKAAARYQIRDLVDIHLDDLTFDILHVGDGHQKTNPQLFVVAAKNANVRAVADFAKAMEWPVTVFDIQETCQRNLQSALVPREPGVLKADSSLVLGDDNKALITISAHGELYYTRRLELPEGFLVMEWTKGQEAASQELDSFTPVAEYVPDYSGGGSPFSTAPATQSDAERAQRLVVEVQRSLDLWDRTWSMLPLAGLWVYAGRRSAELATWLGRETGQTVAAMDLDPLFAGLQDVPPADCLVCVPLLGLLLRQDSIL